MTMQSMYRTVNTSQKPSSGPRVRNTLEKLLYNLQVGVSPSRPKVEQNTIASELGIVERIP